MIVVSAKIRTAPGRRDDFVKAAQPLIAATRAERGCIGYELYADTADANRVMFFEQWASREALDAHMRTPHYLAFDSLRTEQGLVEGGTDVQLFEANKI